MTATRPVRAGRSARIVIVEDDDAIRDAVQVALDQEGYQATALCDGRDIADLVRRDHHDLAIIDVRLREGPNGFVVARALRSASDVAIIFVTAADSVEDRLAGFASGADDYVVKPFSIAELMARVKALLRRSGAATAGTFRVADLAVDDTGRVVTRGDRRIDLTDTEYQLLYALIRHAGQVLSKVQLLSMVWGFDAFDNNLVEVHMSAVRRKIEHSGASRLIHTVRGAGYVLREAP